MHRQSSSIEPNDASDSTPISSSASASSKLSYKFQRLREKLRSAIASGELNGKLPGERLLARKFHVNAKTLSKALTDLAAEGLLERTIGRGTFVKGSGSSVATIAPADRWLVICDEDRTASGVIERLKHLHENIQIVSDTSQLRPSFLNPVKAVIDLSTGTPDELIRDLIVRNIAVVLVGREPTTYSVSSVLIDRTLAATCLGRDMMLQGHRHFLAVERKGQTAVAEALRCCAERYALGEGAVVDSVYPDEVPAAVEQSGATAVVCDLRKSAIAVREALDRKGISVPQRVSLAAIGSGRGEYPCSGYFLNSEYKADTIVQLLRESGLKRPATLWLTGTYFDAGTIAVPYTIAMQAARAEKQQHLQQHQDHRQHAMLRPPR